MLVRWAKIGKGFLFPEGVLENNFSSESCQGVMFYIVILFGVTQTDSCPKNVEWKVAREQDRRSLQDQIIDIDSRLDKGVGSTIDVADRANAFWSIVKIDQKIAIDLAQQARIKWAIEGDENSKKIHGGDIIKAVKEFFRSSIFPNGCNPSFISLIPKVIDAKIINEFRPISLIVFQYKIISKILANRLSEVVDELVSHEQSALIKGRQILDGPLILNEVISWCKARNRQALIFKVDFQKAYDSVLWDYLDELLEKFGFGYKWRGWIRGCLQSSKASILVNGSPTDEFSFRRGLRQGDPLSPFLFILVMESLHVAFQRIIARGMFSPLLIGKGELVSVSHLFYADDVMFLGKWSRENMNALVMMLHIFSLLLG
ncbi:RNA-directed DNA polymerase, eukaryota [Tanacetum coccineum]